MEVEGGEPLELELQELLWCYFEVRNLSGEEGKENTIKEEKEIKPSTSTISDLWCEMHSR